MLAGDLDGDGISDLLVHGLATLQILFGSSDGTFRPAPAPLDAGYYAPVALADLDQDGKLDLLSFKAPSGTSPGGSYSGARRRNRQLWTPGPNRGRRLVQADWSPSRTSTETAVST